MMGSAAELREQRSVCCRSAAFSLGRCTIQCECWSVVASPAGELVGVGAVHVISRRARVKGAARSVTGTRWEIVGCGQVVCLYKNVEARVEGSFGFACQEDVLMIAPSVNKDAAETTCDAAEMTKTCVGNVGAAWEVPCRVEERSGTVESVNHVVDGTALFLLSMRCAKEHPVACIHRRASLWASVLVAFLLEGGEPWGGKIEDEATKLFVDPDIGVDILQDAIVFGLVLAFTLVDC